MKNRLAERMGEPAVQADIRTVAGLAAIYCDGNHADRVRGPVRTDAVLLGVYRQKIPVLCDECAAHIGYAEHRTAHCRKDPKPFCQHCEVHCYSPAEAEWQRQMMRYSGPRSIWHGLAIQGVKHAVASAKWRRRKKREAAARA